MRSTSNSGARADTDEPFIIQQRFSRLNWQPCLCCTALQLEARTTYYVSRGTAILAVNYGLEARATYIVSRGTATLAVNYGLDARATHNSGG
jgi:hypothetical protein